MWDISLLLSIIPQKKSLYKGCSPYQLFCQATFLEVEFVGSRTSGCGNPAEMPPTVFILISSCTAWGCPIPYTLNFPSMILKFLSTWLANKQTKTLVLFVIWLQQCYTFSFFPGPYLRFFWYKLIFENSLVTGFVHCPSGVLFSYWFINFIAKC